MNTMLFEKLRRPALWERSSAPFWDDGHISKCMLEAHLSPDTDAASRSPRTIEQSVEWLARVIPSGARVLDLGCGPGLYTKRLSERGYDVFGIDLSKRSIEYAQAHDPASQYVCASYLEYDFCDLYDAVTLIYCDYAALTDPERVLLLEKIRRALKPGGLFIFDVFSDVMSAKKREVRTWSYNGHGGFMTDAPHLLLEATFLYENGAVSCDKYVVITDSDVTEHIIWDRCYSVQSLTSELEGAGFSVQGIYADVCGSKPDSGSDTLCAVAYRR